MRHELRKREMRKEKIVTEIDGEKRKQHKLLSREEPHRSDTIVHLMLGLHT
jgi:hypothetical protein